MIEKRLTDIVTYIQIISEPGHVNKATVRLDTSLEQMTMVSAVIGYACVGSKHTENKNEKKI